MRAPHLNHLFHTRGASHYASLDEAVWERSTFQDVCFDYTNARNIALWACDLTDVSFRFADLRDVGFGGNIGKACNSFRNVDFTKAKLRGSAHGFEPYENCDFSHADLYEVNFSGARFQNCKFAGVLDSVRFCLHSQTTPPAVLPWHSVNPNRYFNRMDHVDFSSAILLGVEFDGGVDLSHCVFPNDEDHLVIHNQHKVYLKVRDIIVAEWEGEDRRFALGMLDDVYLRPSKKDQLIDIENKIFFKDAFGSELGIKYFNLLKCVNEEYLSASGR